MEVFEKILEYDELFSSLNLRNKVITVLPSSSDTITLRSIMLLIIQDGNTPLHLASYNGFKELVQKLKRKGATIVVKNEVCTISCEI